MQWQPEYVFMEVAVCSERLSSRSLTILYCSRACTQGMNAWSRHAELMIAVNTQASCMPPTLWQLADKSLGNLYARNAKHSVWLEKGKNGIELLRCHLTKHILLLLSVWLYRQAGWTKWITMTWSWAVTKAAVWAHVGAPQQCPHWTCKCLACAYASQFRQQFIGIWKPDMQQPSIGQGW